jgi:predicted Zn finger-like uncharacterized protein
MIRFPCPNCQAEFVVGPQKAGKTVQCSKCQSQFEIPEHDKKPASLDPNAPVEISPCPNCNTALSVATQHLGQEVECPTCQQAFTAKIPKVRDSEIADDEPTPRRKSKTVSDDEERPSKRKSRRAEDDDDDEDDYRPRKKSRKRRRSHVESKRIIAGVLALVLGGFGAHKFVLGYTNPAVIMLVTSLVGVMGFFGGMCCYLPFILCIGNIAMSIIGIIEGIVYLTKSDAEFIETYQFDQKEWF